MAITVAGDELKKKIRRPSAEYTTNHLCFSGQGNFKRGDIKCSSKADCLSMDEGNEWFITQPSRLDLKACCKLKLSLQPILVWGLRDEIQPIVFPH